RSASLIDSGLSSYLPLSRIRIPPNFLKITHGQSMFAKVLSRGLRQEQHATQGGHRDQDDVKYQRPILTGKGLDERRGDDGGQAPGQRRGELVAERGAGVAQTCPEQLGDQRSLYAVEHCMAEGHCRHGCQNYPDRLAGLEQCVVWPGKCDEEEAAADVRR